jgi:hypothetical protein
MILSMALFGCGAAPEAPSARSAPANGEFGAPRLRREDVDAKLEEIRSRTDLTDADRTRHLADVEAAWKAANTPPTKAR